jgi:UDP-glucose 4-epimerase/UDP-glucuronate decarboxylase
VADRVLVTGGAGFVGYHLASALVERGYRVTLVDDLSRGRVDADLRALLDHVELVQHDLTEPLPGVALGNGWRYVYHLAAVVGVQRANGQPARVLRTNLLSTVNVLDWCARVTPEAVFLSSTSEIGDGAARLGLTGYPVPESAAFALPEPHAPRTSYSVSKLAGELLTMHMAEASGFRARIARYHNVYGPRMGHSHVIPQFIDRVLDGVTPFPLYGAHQTRAFCHVRDAVDATIRLTELPGDEPVLANVGNDREELPIIDLARTLFELVGVSPPLEIHDPPAGSPDRRLPDLTRLRALTGYEPSVPLSEGLADTYEWYARDRAATRVGAACAS